MPGPTGEANTLTLYPRAVLVAFGGETERDIRRQVLLALSVGAAVIAVETKDNRKSLKDLTNAIAKANLPRDLFSIASEKLAGALLESDIDGVLADGAMRVAVANHLSRRAGAILPVLSGFDEPERLCYERTLTVDLTAAGGNATLLAMT